MAQIRMGGDGGVQVHCLGADPGYVTIARAPYRSFDRHVFLLPSAQLVISDLRSAACPSSMATVDAVSFTFVADDGSEIPTTQDFRNALQKGSDEVKCETLQKIIRATLNGNAQVSTLAPRDTASKTDNVICSRHSSCPSFSTACRRGASS